MLITPRVGQGKRGPEGHIAYLLRQAQFAVRQAHEAAFEDLGVTAAQFLLLNLLDAYPGASGAELARIAQLTPQTINLIVRKLESDGLLDRQEHETHGRVLRTRLSTRGLAALRRCKARSKLIEQKMLQLLDAKSEQKVRQWLVDVADSFSRE